VQMILTLAAALALSTPSHATTGLQWNWDDTSERQYLTQSSTMLVYPEVLQGEGTGEVIFTDLVAAMVTPCRATEPMGKKAFAVSCVVDELTLQGLPQYVEDAERAQTVLASVSKACARITSRFGRDGHVSKIDLRDLDQSNTWMSIKQPTLQTALGHAVGGLDLHLPKEGDDKGMGTWKQREAKPMTLAIRDFTLGTIKMTHTLTSTDGSQHTLTTESRGTLTPGAESEGEGTGITYDTSMQVQRSSTPRRGLSSRAPSM
jgi:hypothetical protein